MTTAPSRDVVDLLRWLVQQDSTTGTVGERRALGDMADLVRQWVGTRGSVRLDPEHDAVVAMPAEGDGPILLFASHIDTVPVGDAGAWDLPPLGAVIRDGVLHGRGASDMKAGLAAAIVAGVAALADGVRVALAVTTGEEMGCLGAPALERLMEDREIAAVRAVILPEATNNVVALGHRGAYWASVAVNGVAAHGSTPDRGVNAVRKLVSALGEIDSLPLREHTQLGAETVNIGAISGGLAHNIVPAHAHALIDHRIVDADITGIARWWAHRVDEIRTDLTLDPVWSDASDGWIRSLPAPTARQPVPYFTDASVLVRMLAPSTPIVVWGPGDPTTVHAKDEHVSLAAVERAVDLYRAVNAAWPWRG